ncbi:MAG: hypothetical protein OXF66_06730 [Gammaproteobacteria bacterium]|nr:hypothetical protein [Gammaproteobacteria bacterium]MCY4256453.1 hypothetical protein [Gammaproteobacteria bacterium]
MNDNIGANGARDGIDVAAALRALPPADAPADGWKRVLERHEAARGPQPGRRRYWGRGLAVAAGLAAAVIGVRLGGGVFSGIPASENNGMPAGAAAGEFVAADAASGFVPVALESNPAQMDLDALIAFSQFQEERLQALPLGDWSRPGRILEVDAFGLATALEDQIALLDEGLIPASLNSQDESMRHRLLRERAQLMDDLFSLRRAEAAEAGYFHADF